MNMVNNRMDAKVLNRILQRVATSVPPETNILMFKTRNQARITWTKLKNVAKNYPVLIREARREVELGNGATIRVTLTEDCRRGLRGKLWHIACRENCVTSARPITAVWLDDLSG